MNRRRHTTVGQMQAVLTDAEIAAILNERYRTTRNNRKNVAQCRHNAEKKLRSRLLHVFEQLKQERQRR